MRILIAEQHTLLRTTIAELIRNHRPEWEVTQTADLAEARERLRDGGFDVLLVGIDLLEARDPRGLASLRQAFPWLKLVVRVGVPNRQVILSCFRSGADGCVIDSMSATDLLLALRCVVSGEAAFNSVFSELAPPGSARSPLAGLPRRLTERQSEVLNLLGKGRSTKEIARTLDLSVGTIKVHLASIYRTLGARNRVEATIKAAEMSG